VFGSPLLCRVRHRGENGLEGQNHRAPVRAALPVLASTASPSSWKSNVTSTPLEVKRHFHPLGRRQAPGAAQRPSPAARTAAGPRAIGRPAMPWAVPRRHGGASAATPPPGPVPAAWPVLRALGPDPAVASAGIPRPAAADPRACSSGVTVLLT